MGFFKGPDIPASNALPRVHYLTIWISLSVVVLLCITDIIRGLSGTISDNMVSEPMKIITAICFLMAVCILLLFQFRQSRFLFYVQIALWILMMLAAVYTESEHLCRYFTGTWTALSSTRPFSYLMAFGNRMSFITSVSISVLGVILLLLKWGRHTEAHVITIFLAGLAYFYLIVYILGIKFPVSQIDPISLNTGISLAGLCIAVFMLYPDTWLLKVFTSGSLGGIMARQLLIPSLLIPIIAGWFSLAGEQHELFDSETGIALITLFYTFCFAMLVWLAASSINKVDVYRQMSEESTARSNVELIQLNRTLNALSKTSQAMIHTTDEVVYLRDVCRIIAEDCGYSMVWIGFVLNDPDKSVKPVAHYGFDEEYIRNMKVSWANDEYGRGPTGTAVRTGKPAICRNMLTDPHFAPWREDAVKRGYSSSMVLPLTTDNKVFGSVSVYSSNPDAFGNDDVKLLNNLASDIAYGISYIRMAISELNAARATKESEEKYRQLFEQMTEGFALHELILDQNGEAKDYRFISVNPAFEKQTGLQAELVTGKTAREVLPNFEDHWLSIYSEVALTGKSTEFESYSSDLRSYFRVSSFSPKKGFFATIFENINQRVTAEKELQNTKNYLENLINFANSPIIVWNASAQIQLFNHAFEKLTGYKASEVTGRKLDILFPESSMADSNLKIKEALTSNLETIEIPILTSDNQIRTILWNSANIYDPDSGEVVSTIAQGYDITERIQAENEVRLAKAKLDLALENANIGIWTWDIFNNHLDCDERIARMFGVDPAELLGFEDFERCIYDEDIAHFNRAMNKALKENKSLDTIFRIKLKSGDFNYIDAKAKLETDQDGNAYRMTGVCLDITAMQKATELTMISLNEDLLRSNKELEEFAYVASHDLQEPLRMVSSFTQLLAARYKDKLDSQAKEFIDFAVDGAQRMQRLINDLLQYSRIKTRGKALSFTDLNDVIKQTLHNLSIKIKEKNAIITYDQLPVVNADDGQMVQLFQNLIDNSLKFCNNQPVIHISVAEENGNYRIILHDNGIGIEPQYFDRIFQIFQRLHLRDEYGGTGIGLAICKRIVERHGGKIWVESNGEGAQFQFTIKKS